MDPKSKRVPPSPSSPTADESVSKEATTAKAILFDFSAFPENTLFHERRTPPPPPETEPQVQVVEDRRPVSKKERRKRVDPCTFEKQYTPEETEFMNAMQQFKSQTGKAFPTHEDVLKVAWGLGYRKIGKPTPLPGCSHAHSDADANANALVTKARE